MFVESIEAASTAISTIELTEKLVPTFKKVFNLLKDGDLKIAIFGAGGTGKTTLGKLLSRNFDSSNLFQSYQESISTEQYKLDSNVFGSVTVVPGQERREDTWDDLLRNIAGGKVKLIIHVVSWGYHSFGAVSYTDHKLYQSGMTPTQFVEEYTKSFRERELAVLKKIEPHISISDRKKTVFITLVTKQDLWWNSRSQVKQHYEKGEYGRIIQEIQSKKGTANFIHEYCSASLVTENFISGTGELLEPTTEGYDRRLQFANSKNFINTIESMFKVQLNLE